MASVEKALTTAPAQVARHFILGTAGHIDHGKTSLVAALTGTNTDRLPEEQRRGMTIELGFAELQIEDAAFGIVDVPGHERFIRTMVAGATGIDVALLVVAADDSVMPQTVEHVEILRLLGIKRTVVAITKIDLVDEDMAEFVEEDVRTLVGEAGFAEAPICRVSSTSGAGIDTLRRRIVETASQVTPPPTGPPFRMAIDRVFTVAGRGTVVTGSVFRGTVARGAALQLLPDGHTCKVRDLQTHGKDHEEVGSGERAAINVSGVDRALIHRGCELATPGYVEQTRMMNIRVESLPSCPRPIKSGTTLRLCMATSQVRARIVLFDDSLLEPGSSAFAQLRSGEPMIGVYGQRFILRDETASRTVGGGMILEPVAHRRRRTMDVDRKEILRILQDESATDRVEQILRAARFQRPSDLGLCARSGAELSELPGIIDELIQTQRWELIPKTKVRATRGAIDDLTRRFLAWLRRFHVNNPELPGRKVDAVVGWLSRMTDPTLGRPLLDEFTRTKVVTMLGSFVCLPDFAPELSNADRKHLEAIIDELRNAGFQPPSLETLQSAGQLDRKRLDRLATLAVTMGELVFIEGRTYLHVDSEKRLRELVTELAAEPDGTTVAEVREALDSSRKYVVPFLEHLDRRGFTKRVGDRRILAD